MSTVGALTHDEIYLVYPSCTDSRCELRDADRFRIGQISQSFHKRFFADDGSLSRLEYIRFNCRYLFTYFSTIEDATLHYQ